jgi:hypothetical protein
MGPEVEGFEQLERVAAGGSATVYRAFQPAFDRWVALKVLDRGDDRGDLVGELEEECRLVGRLTDHPNVVTVFGSGAAADGAPYVSMAWFEGGSLEDRIARGRPLSARELASVGIRLAAALESAHRFGMLHLDVKPANVVFNRLGEPALTDFGAGSRLAAGTGAVRGYTPEYAAPEVRSGRGGLGASDVWSLGRTLRASVSSTDDLAPEVAGLLDRMEADDPAERPSLHDVIALLGEAESACGWSATVPVLLGPGQRDAQVGGPDPSPTLPPAAAGAALATAPRRRGPPRRTLVGLTAVVAVAAIVVVVLLSGGDGRRTPAVVDGTTTGRGTTAGTATTAGPDVGTVVHPTDLADSSPQMRVALVRVPIAVRALTGDTPLSSDLGVSAYFSTASSFPPLAPLPTTARWYFQRDGSGTPPCDSFRSDPITMRGFAGTIAAGTTSIVTVATYELADADEASELFGGRSLSLGPADDECEGKLGAPKRVRHRAVDVDALSVPVDDVNTYRWDGPGELGEKRAYGVVVRRGARIWELRVGMRDDRSLEAAALMAFASTVIGPA